MPHVFAVYVIPPVAMILNCDCLAENVKTAHKSTYVQQFAGKPVLWKF